MSNNNIYLTGSATWLVQREMTEFMQVYAYIPPIQDISKRYTHSHLSIIKHNSMARLIRIRILDGIWWFDFIRVSTIFIEFTDHHAMLLPPRTAVRTGFGENPRSAIPVNLLRIPVDLTNSQREDLGSALARNRLITNQRLLLLHVFSRRVVLVSDRQCSRR